MISADDEEEEEEEDKRFKMKNKELHTYIYIMVTELRGMWHGLKPFVWIQIYIYL